MSRPAERLRMLAEAAGRESEAARSLTEALRDLRTAAEFLDDDRLQACLARAEGAAAALSRAGAARIRLANEEARALGLPAGTPLSGLAGVGGAGGELATFADGLTRALEGVAYESAALGVCTRYGAASCAHLIEMRQRATGASSYGPGGVAGPSPSRLACRA